MKMYEVKKFDLIGLEGFSDDLLNNHFKLYAGYVKRTNDAIGKAEQRRRFGWEFNGMRLHELYFGNLIKGGKKLDPESKLAKKIVRDFGSYEKWEEDFKSVGSMPGIGWVVLAYDSVGDKLFNIWINEHDVGLVGKSILVMDVFEHAFMVDYGLDKMKYVKAFFNAINWEEVGQRLH